MTIKRSLIIMTVVTSLCVVGFASAKGWGGGQGSCECQGYGPGYQNLDADTKAKVDGFMTETKELRKQMAMKRAERTAIMAADNPDPAAAARVAGEMFDLRTEMRDKAKSAGVPFISGSKMMERTQMGNGYRHGRAKGFDDGRGNGPCYKEMQRRN